MLELDKCGISYSNLDFHLWLQLCGWIAHTLVLIEDSSSFVRYLQMLCCSNNNLFNMSGHLVQLKNDFPVLGLTFNNTSTWFLWWKMNVFVFYFTMFQVCGWDRWLLSSERLNKPRIAPNCASLDLIQKVQTDLLVVRYVILLAENIKWLHSFSTNELWL